jgi:hypothetical protein
MHYIHPEDPSDPRTLPCLGCPSCAAQAQRISDLETATRRLVEALEWATQQLDRGDGVLEYTGPLADGDKAKDALEDPTLVTLRRE